MGLEKEQRRSKIREIAAKVFAENGFERTTIRGIAKAGGISAASIYYYFDSKEELLYQVLDETMSTGLRLIEEIEKGDADLKDKLNEMLRTHTLTAINFDKMKLLIHEQSFLSAEHRDALNRKQTEYLEKLTHILEALKQNGDMRDLDAKACAFAFFGMVSWAYRWFDPKGNISTAQLAEIFAGNFHKRNIYKKDILTQQSWIRPLGVKIDTLVARFTHKRV